MKHTVVSEFPDIDQPEYDFPLPITLSGNEWGCITATLNVAARRTTDRDYADRLIALRDHLTRKVVEAGPEEWPES